MRIVWMMRGPGLTPGQTIDAAPALEIDVAPTLLDLVGLEPTPTMEGRSWVGCLEAGRCPPFPSGRPFWVYAVDHDSRRPEAMAGYRWPYKWMWQHGFPREAYELGRDPWEEEELLRASQGLAARRARAPRRAVFRRAPTSGGSPLATAARELFQGGGAAQKPRVPRNQAGETETETETGNENESTALARLISPGSRESGVATRAPSRAPRSRRRSRRGGSRR